MGDAISPTKHLASHKVGQSGTLFCFGKVLALTERDFPYFRIAF